MNANERGFKVGQIVRCWGIPNGPYKGKIKAKGTSKDCWVVRVRKGTFHATFELHEDYLKAKG